MDKTILIVEDDATQRVILEAFLRKRMNLNAYTAENGRKALEILQKHHNKINLIISDIEMPVMNGIETLKHIRKLYPTHPVIMLTGTNDITHAVDAMKLGAVDFVTKPYDKDRIMVTIQNVLKMKTMTAEIIRLQNDKQNRFSFSNMIGHDKGLLESVKIGRKAAAIDLPILINGETGTGKELFAKALHGESVQSGESFVPVNCGAIPSELIESTLFGHEKGAFTGATESAIGKFREADQGTLFLDEVGELPLEAQVKLLRVLQEKEVEPVGASRPIKVNVRIVAATHRNLEDDVKKGLFREDLYYRLNVLKIDLPSLRDRTQDIAELVTYFMDKISIAASMQSKTIEETAFQRLIEYHWPGNVRELENMINRAFVLGDDNVITIDDFEFQSERKEVVEVSNKTKNSTKTMSEMEKEMMQNALRTMGGNVTKAAESLGIAKSTFYRKKRQHKIV